MKALSFCQLSFYYFHIPLPLGCELQYPGQREPLAQQGAPPNLGSQRNRLKDGVGDKELSLEQITVEGFVAHSGRDD